ncbi:hypothetical protein I5Q34_25220 [Streptomyces sp. AV19]|uniref:hypothetical protein n=1 Tax=Streptomyces sp. AV19 TaxID=2793068 RepID=UPI0018FEFB5C|nr:hypothetical protein [Streptomyces sp. AV19]MBH1937531.1 hypothetical protein [Streptomyces sp. AV19]MDG4533693.1 hypothetical protein [Streptomyces sp. AV19]
MVMCPAAPGQPPGPPIPGSSPPPDPPDRPPAPSRPLIEHHAGPPGGTATRYLCAAAHLDRAFRDAVITELVEHPHRVPAPSPGTDLVRVLHECLRARRAPFLAGLAILAVLAAGALWGSWSATLLVLLTVVLLRLTGAGSDATAVALPDEVAHVRSFPGRVVQFVGQMVAVFLLTSVLVSVWVPVEGGLTVFEREVLARLPADVASVVAAPGPGAYVTLLTLLWLIGVVRRYRVLGLLGDRKGPLSGSAPAPGTRVPSLRRVYSALRSQQDGPELLYRDRAPLIGLGLPLEGWSIALELVPAKDPAEDPAEDPAKDEDGGPLAPDPVDAAVLHRAITTAVLDLGRGPGYPGDALHRLTVGDRVFRPGMRRGPAGAWLGGMSVRTPGGSVTLDERWARALELYGHERLRHFLAIRVGSWQEDVVTTVLMRATTQGGVLHLEWQPYLLPPTALAYRAVDSFAPADPLVDGLTVMGQAAWGLGRDMGAALGQVLDTLGSAVRAAHNRCHYRRLVRCGYDVDHAPTVSVRELGAETQFRHVFQEFDVDRFLSTLWVRTQTAVHKELKQRGYDVSEFEQQAQHIVNNITNGVQINGGTQNGPVTGGPGARTRVTAPRPRVGRSRTT